MIALFEIQGFQNIEIMLIADITVRYRSEVDVGDNRILRAARVDCAGRNTGDHLVLADTGKRISAECNGSGALVIVILVMRACATDAAATTASCKGGRDAELQQFALGEFRWRVQVTHCARCQPCFSPCRWWPSTAGFGLQ